MAPSLCVVEDQVRDDDNGESIEYSDSVTVNNVAPLATPTRRIQVNEGSDINVSLSDVDGSGHGRHAEYRFKCGDGHWIAYAALSQLPRLDHGQRHRRWSRARCVT